jgi:hypothetical protein
VQTLKALQLVGDGRLLAEVADEFGHHLVGDRTGYRRCDRSNRPSLPLPWRLAGIRHDHWLYPPGYI